MGFRFLGGVPLEGLQFKAILPGSGIVGRVVFEGVLSLHL